MIIFPGDPPMREFLGLLLSVVGIMALLVLVPCRIAAKRWPEARTLRWASRFLSLVVGIGMAGGVILVLELAPRHREQWKPIRDALLRESLRIRAAAGPSESLDSSQYQGEDLALRERKDLRFKSEGGEREVRVLLMSPVPPYVGVDFGGGQRAIFEPRTMRTLYTD